MSERRRVLILILIMTVIALIVGGVSIIVLYGAAFEQGKARLVETAQSQARLLEAIARFSADYSQDFPGGAEAATLSQIRDAHENYQGFGETGEFTLAKREGDLIVFLLSHRHYDLDWPKPVPFDSDLAEPMRLSLSGQSGTVVGPDYRGVNVLAAYEPVSGLGWGIVAKIDLAEIRAPFIKAGVTVGLSAVIIVILGAVLFVRMTDPLLRRLAESERRFRGAFEQAAVGITHMALDGRYLKTNQRFCDIIGYTQSEALDLTFQEITHPDDLDANMADSRQLFEGKVQHFSKEKRYIRKDGSVVWVKLTVSLMREPSGEPQYTINVVEDITEQVQAEFQRDATLEALRESEERYRLLFEQMLSGFALHEIICDESDRPVDYRFLEINPAFEKLTGLRAEDLLGRTVRQAMPGIEQYWIDRYGRVALTGEPISFEDYAQDLGKYYEVAAFSPQLDRVAVIFHDVTARRRAEEALKQRAAQLAILNDVGAKIAAALELDRVLDRAARLVQESFNYHHVGLFILDREREEMVMKVNAGSYTDLYHDHRLKLDVGMVGWVGRHGETLLANDVSAELHHLNPFPDEDRMVTQSELSVPIKAGGKLIGALDVQSPQLNAFDENDVLVIETLADQIAVAMENARLYEAVRQELSERVRAEEQLKEYSERLEEMVQERTQELQHAQEQLVRREKLAILGQLAGGIGHELRNPLGVISNAAYYLQLVLTDADETTREYLDIISSEVRNSEKIISDLLNFALTKPAARAEISLLDLAASVLKKHPSPEGVQVITEIPSDLPAVFVDPRQMELVLVNLVTNAYQAMIDPRAEPTPGSFKTPNEHQLTLGANSEQDEVVLSVTDTGCGIAPENMERLFEPLFTTKIRGIGLGLAISKNFVEANWGTIKVRSQKGEGSTFTIVLPTKEAVS